MIIFKKQEKEIIKAYRELARMCGGDTDGWVIQNPKNMFSTDWISRHRIERKLRFYKLCEQWEKAEAIEELLEDNKIFEP